MDVTGQMMGSATSRHFALQGRTAPIAGTLTRLAPRTLPPQHRSPPEVQIIAYKYLKIVTFRFNHSDFNPIAHWLFNENIQDQYGDMHMTLHGDAVIQDGYLKVSGQGYAQSSFSNVDFKQKTEFASDDETNEE